MRAGGRSSRSRQTLAASEKRLALWWQLSDVIGHVDDQNGQTDARVPPGGGSGRPQAERRRKLRPAGCTVPAGTAGATGAGAPSKPRVAQRLASASRRWRLPHRASAAVLEECLGLGSCAGSARIQQSPIFGCRHCVIFSVVSRSCCLAHGVAGQVTMTQRN